ncbi:MAG: septal ring lytic transglycosylase RlpA family protein [Acidipropionibacterium sp.]|jgi:rare lipoprotein A|nr:septal ring lytic transglycosylase RlpA family protein [Acidipropionibacterium sp.]
MSSTQIPGHSKSLRRVVAVTAATGVAVMGSVVEQAQAAPAPTKQASAPKPVAAPKPAGPKAASGAGKLVYATTNVNVRSRATTSSAKIGLLVRSGHVKALSASSGGWTKVLYKGKVGYISSSYLTYGKVATSKPASSTAAASSSSGRLVWATSTVNVRSRATTSSAKIGSLTKGAHVKALAASSGGWTKVLYQGKVGYASSGYLSYSKVSAPARPAATVSRSSARVTTTGAVGTCKASFYGYGSQTASGERFNSSAMTAAHKTFRFGTHLKVTNRANGKSVVVRINDRGPYVSGRCLDLSTGAFSRIASTSAGVASVTYQVVK